MASEAEAVPVDPVKSEQQKVFRDMALSEALSDLLNRHSAENESDTPDFILAHYLMKCLAAWEQSVKARDFLYGKEAGRDATSESGRGEATAHEWAGECG